MSAPAIITVPPKTDDSPAYFEAYWRVAQPSGRAKPVKRRLGKAWVEPDGDGGWKKRRGKAPAGWLTLATAHVAAAEAVAQYERDQAEKDRAAAAELVPTVRKVAWEWHEWKRDVKGASPNTLANERWLLMEPGDVSPQGRTYDARIMRTFGDQRIEDVQPKQVARWLADLTVAGLKPRNVNLHRSVLHAIFGYAMRSDTYGLERNPVTSTDRRVEPARADLDVYEVEELEALARVAETGPHRKPKVFRDAPVQRSAAEIQHEAWEDHQDADVFRTLFYSGARVSEALALRPQAVLLSPDLDGGVLLLHRSIKNGQDTTGTKWSKTGRDVPIPRAAAVALAGHLTRWSDRFGREPGPDDYLFCNRFGVPINGTALRKRFYAAADAAGLRRVKLHDLRHAAGSHVGRTEPAMFIRDFLGHSKLSTTDRYTHSAMATPAAIAAVNRAFGTGDPGERSKETA